LINPINTVHNIQVKTAVDKARDQEAESFEEMLQKAAKEQDKEKLREACRDLESVFLNMMFKSMRNTVEKSGLFEESFAANVYEDMLYEKYAQEASKGKGLGLGEMLYQQLVKNLNNEEEV